MAEQRYAVPEAGLKAVIDHHPIKGMLEDDPHMLAVDTLKACLEAFIRWQSENPIMPTKDQVIALYESTPEGHGYTGWAAVEWQRRMYLAPEPEIQTDQEIGEEAGKAFGAILFRESPIQRRLRTIREDRMSTGKIPLQCGQRFEVGGETWQVESISTTGKIATMNKITDTNWRHERNEEL